jgi:seryl-tRNA synthetase
MINYELLAKAQKFYELNGFKYIETPWYVSKEIKDITRPEIADIKNDYILSVNKKYLVASGEQSFLYLYTKGFLPPGKYCTITPCFRFEEIDIFHKKVFMKCELISILDPSVELADVDSLVYPVINLAHEFFTSIGLPGVYSSIIEPHIQKDLNFMGVELGSYGYRSYKDIRWIYGTGCAEPRTSSCLTIQHDLTTSKLML